MPRQGTGPRRCACTSAAAGCSPTSSAPTRRRRPSRSTAHSWRHRRRPFERRRVAEPTVEPGTSELSRDETEAPPLGAEQAAGRRSRKRRAVLFSALGGVIAAAVVVPLVVFGEGGSGGRAAVSAAGDSLGVFDARSGRLVAHIGVGATPTAVAAGEGAYWVSNADGHTVSRIDPETAAVVETIPVGNGPSGIATGAGAVWVVNSLDGTVSRIDPGTNTVVQTIDVGGEPLGIVYAAGSVWVANTGDGTITRIDPESGTRTKTLPVAATELAFGAGTLWASQRAVGKVVRIDPTTGKQVGATQVGNGPTGIAFGDGAAWVANSLDGTVSRIDPDTNSVTALVTTGNGPHAVAIDARGIWVSDQFDGNVVRIDPSTNRVAQPVSVGGRPLGLAMSGDAALVAVRQPGAGHRGGTLVLRAERPRNGDVVDFIDPALATATNTMSTPADDRRRPRRVQPGQRSCRNAARGRPRDVAAEPTDGGRTYTFRLRSGIRYSNGRPVRATDFRSTFERNYALNPPLMFDGIVGDGQCRKHPKRCDLSRGIVADDVAHTVTFNLIRPDPDFLYKLASPFAYVLPGDTPRRPAGTHPLPATGPYMIATYRPKRLLRFIRNPFFREWSQAAQPAGYPDRIDIRIAGTAGRGDPRRRRRQGRCRVVEQPLTRSQASTLEIQYPSQLHSNPSPNIQALFLNTRVPPFDSLDARRAFNFAVDRAAATNAQGGPSLAEPTCQVLPPNIAGYSPYCPYTAGSTKRGKWTAPDLTKAKALVARSGTRGMKVTFWALPGAPLQPAGRECAALARVPRRREAGRRFDRYYEQFPTRATGRRSGSPAGTASDPGVVPGSALQLSRVPAPESREPERDPVLRPGHRPPDAEGAGTVADRPDRVTRTLATDRPRGHRRVTVGDAHCDEGRELPLEARRQLPMEPVEWACSSTSSGCGRTARS